MFKENNYKVCESGKLPVVHGCKTSPVFWSVDVFCIYTVTCMSSRKLICSNKKIIIYRVKHNIASALFVSLVFKVSISQVVIVCFRNGCNK